MQLGGGAAEKEKRSLLLGRAAMCRGPHAVQLAACFGYVALNASTPILLDWVKLHNGGKFSFRTPALVFHAYACGTLLGGVVTLHDEGRRGLQQLLRADMLCRFALTAILFAAGDMLNFMSGQYLDVASYTLVGKSMTIVFTVLFCRIVLGRGQETAFQHALVVVIAVATAAFCQAELDAKRTRGGWGASADDAPAARDAAWWLGLFERIGGVGCASMAAVLTQRLLAQHGTPFLLQQFWMGSGAMCTSLAALLLAHRLPLSSLLEGFADWRVLMLLAAYTGSGLCAGLIVKHLGAVAKALCTPVHLGACYGYAVHAGSAAFTLWAVGSWLVGVACILAFAFSKMPMFAKSAWNPARWGGGGAGAARSR